MSKGSSGVHFGYFLFQTAAFFDLKVMRGREIRRLKAEIIYFSKMKFSRSIEYILIWQNMLIKFIVMAGNSKGSPVGTCGKRDFFTFRSEKSFFGV